MRVHTVFSFSAGLTTGALLLMNATGGATPPAIAPPTLEEMLQDFVTDYRLDATAEEITFGIEVRDADTKHWQVTVGPREEGEAEAPVFLDYGLPTEPAAYFTMDLDTLRRLHVGELAALTAMGKAFSTDFAPLDMKETEGFQPDEQESARLMRVSFHFWTRGFPEIIPFGERSLTRELHGADGVLFYYQPGFRSGWFDISPGQHVNSEPGSNVNPFPTLLICVEGSATALIGDVECTMRGGAAIFVGPGVRHEFWVDEDAAEGARGVLLMFGDGA